MLRISGGELRGRSVQSPAGDETRPTQARLREALFNTCQAAIPGARVLELFAGSGIQGFEAVSRGAEAVVLVERSKRAVEAIRRSVTELAIADRVTVVPDTIENFLKKKWPPFDVVLADPPYSEGYEQWLLEEFPWREILVPGGLFYLEWSPLRIQREAAPAKRSDRRSITLPDAVSGLVKVREKPYGDTMLTTYRLEESSIPIENEAANGEGESV